jgi:Protein of unknown function (DUF1353)
MSATAQSQRKSPLTDQERTPFSWDGNTKPFSAGDGSQPARFELRQVGDDDFQLLKPFSFTSAAGTTIPVRHELLGRTDLASIPSFLGWFARRHGRHTPAALLHDELITDTPGQLPAEVQLPPVKADRLFREALRASEVALVKAWVLWTGVTLLTRWRSRPWGRAGIVGWFAAALAGTSLLIVGAATGQPVLVAIALVAPVPFAALWGRQYAAGLIAGYAFWPVAFGSVPGWLAYQVYQGVEQAVRVIGRLRPRDKRTPLQPPKPFDQR